MSRKKLIGMTNDDDSERPQPADDIGDFNETRGSGSLKTTRTPADLYLSARKLHAYGCYKKGRKIAVFELARCRRYVDEIFLSSPTNN